MDTMIVFLCPRLPEVITSTILQELNNSSLKIKLNSNLEVTEYIICLPCHYDEYNKNRQAHILTPLWLLRCLFASHLISTDGYSANPYKYFSGCIISLQYVTTERKLVYSDVITHFGGIVLLHDIHSTCTHIIYENELDIPMNSDRSIHYSLKIINDTDLIQTNDQPQGVDLEGLFILMQGFTNEDIKKLNALSTSNHNSTNEYIVHTGNAIVSKYWLLDCIKNKCLIPVEKYLHSSSIILSKSDIPNESPERRPSSQLSNVLTDSIMSRHSRLLKNFKRNVTNQIFLSGVHFYISPLFHTTTQQFLLTIIKKLGGLATIYQCDGGEINQIATEALFVCPDIISLPPTILSLGIKSMNVYYILYCAEFYKRPNYDQPYFSLIYGLPKDFLGIPSMRNFVIAITGFKDSTNSNNNNNLDSKCQISRSEIKILITLSGACYTGNLLRGVCTHLITTEASSEKVTSAKKWKDEIQIVTADWLISCLQAWSAIEPNMSEKSLIQPTPMIEEIPQISVQNVVTTAFPIAPIISTYTATLPNIMSQHEFIYDAESLPAYTEPCDSTSVVGVVVPTYNSTKGVPLLTNQTIHPISTITTNNTDESTAMVPIVNSNEKHHPPHLSTITKPENSRHKDITTPLYEPLISCPNMTVELNKEGTVCITTSKCDEQIVDTNLIEAVEHQHKEYIFLLSSIGSDADIKLIDAILTLGGIVIGTEDPTQRHSYHHECTHVILSEPLKRTEKLLCACVAGKWILRSDFVLDSLKNGKWLDENNYEWGCSTKFNITASIWPPIIKIHRTISLSILYNVDIYLHGEYDNNLSQLLHNLIKAGKANLIVPLTIIKGGRRNSVDITTALTAKKIVGLPIKPAIIISSSSSDIAKKDVVQYCQDHNILLFSPTQFMDLLTTQEGYIQWNIIGGNSEYSVGSGRNQNGQNDENVVIVLNDDTVWDEMKIHSGRKRKSI